MTSWLLLSLASLENRGMTSNRLSRHPPFRGRWFADEVILTCVRWYLRFKLSYRDLAELARELGVRVAPSTILRWVIRTCRSWRNAGKPMSGRSAIPGRVDSDLPQGMRSMDVPLPRC